jgi:hypothetical protein
MSFLGLHAQDEDDSRFDKIRDKMNEFIQKRLELNKNEAEKFSPVFLRYFREWRSTLQQYKGDKLLLRQKITEVQIRYRTEFREAIGEKRGSEVFRHQKIFIDGLKNAAEHRENRIERRQNTMPKKNTRTVLN